MKNLIFNSNNNSNDNFNDNSDNSNNINMESSSFIENSTYIEKINNIFIKNIKIIDVVNDKEYYSDILIENNVLKAIGKNIPLPTDDKKLKKLKDKLNENNENNDRKIKIKKNFILIDGNGLVAAPAFTDIHVHLREPGDEQKEDIKSIKASAFHGGVTSVFSMPNSNPCVDKDFLVKYILLRASQENFKIYPVAAITRNLEGQEITEFGLLKQAGAIALSDDGKCVQDSKLMYEAMKYAAQFQIPLILHEEDYRFSQNCDAHEGYYSAKLGLDGMSSLSEEIIIARDILLAQKTKVKLHITHISSKGSVELIKEAKQKGINISCDVTPHHIFFNDSFLENYNTNFKVNPPIRSEQDKEALIEGLKSGVIDAIASDHAPHLLEEKNTTFKQAAFGVTGLETLFSACYTQLCKNKGFKISKLISLMSYLPRKIFGLNFKNISNENIGKKIDLVLIDTKSKIKITNDFFFSKSLNSPFLGMQLDSEIICTINNGKIVYLKNGF